MIEGLNLDVKASELATHCEARIAAHSAKVQENSVRLETLRGAGLPENTGTSMQSPVSGLVDNIKGHKIKMQFFEFVRAHLVGGETYRFDDNDLARLEFIEGRY